jgi:1-deoxy-D-xylulose-5-phosphate reductoisomerase
LKKAAVLGATGSIGKSSLDVLRHGNFEPVLFTAHTDSDGLLKLKDEFPHALLALSGEETAFPPHCDIEANDKIEYSGRQGLLDAITNCDADIIINGITGAAGLEPSIAALNTGACLALANKETMVMAGPLVLALAEEKHTKIIPVDSEHSAIFHLIEAHGKENIEEIILTASGGPFRNYPLERLAEVGSEEALEHPTYNMGPKITVDSATLANKGLEVIEAVRFFGFPPEKIKVLIHPQSIVHSMVRVKDGAVYAQLSKPDMRHPIYCALHWPEIAPSSFGALDFHGLSLDFENPDTLRFPMLSLAYAACQDNLHPAAYNAANESAVEAFLEGRISFLEIPRIVEYVLSNRIWSETNRQSDRLQAVGDHLQVVGLKEILEADKTARNLAFEFIRRKTK